MRFAAHTPDDFDVALNQVSGVTLSPTITQLSNALRRSRLSTRRAVTNEANRRGLLAGITSRADSRAAALVAAADSAAGRDPYGFCEIADHWRPLFKRVFVKAALYAARPDTNVTVRV